MNPYLKLKQHNPPHRTYASQVNRCSSFTVSKQSCQTIAAAAINLFINFYGIAAPAMPFGCSASLHSLSCCLQFRFIPHGSYCVLHATLFITSFVTLHFASFAAWPFASSLSSPFQPTERTHNVCNSLSASHPCHTHGASFRFTTSFIHFSSVQYTRCP
jgi:hypothetical protein